MNSTDKNKKKQEILVNVSDTTKRHDTTTISETSNIRIELVSYLIEEIRDEGYVELIEITTRNSSRAPREYIASITNKGKYFLTIDNGFFSVIKKEKRKRIWYRIKTIALVLNSIAIIAIGAYSLILSQKNNKLENEKRDIEKELKEMKSIVIQKDTVRLS